MVRGYGEAFPESRWREPGPLVEMPGRGASGPSGLFQFRYRFDHNLELGSGPQNAEALALRMLREVKAFRSMPPEQRTSEPVRSMRRELAEELRRLREQLR